MRHDKRAARVQDGLERGEPRGKHKKGESWEGRGHCIDCTACVQVCPTGIDIREGLQMECIACGLCVDACNDIMDKIDLPRGLIRYDTTHHMEAKEKGGEEQFRFWRPRTIYYGLILAVVGAVMLSALIFRSPVELHVLRDRNPLYVQLSSGMIRNGYVIKILNKTHQHRVYGLSVEGLDNATIDVKAAGDIDSQSLYVPADSVGSYHIYISADVDPASPRDIQIRLKATEDSSIKESTDTVFITRQER